MMKKLCLFILAAMMSLLQGWADERVFIDGIMYRLNSNSEAIVEFHEYKGDVIIPEYIYFSDKKYDVTEIDSYAFDRCEDLTSVTIPNSVKVIGYEAFIGCTSMTSVTLSNSITELAGRLFCGCTTLTSVTIPNSVKKIGYGAFEGCTSMSSVTIPNCVTYIEMYAFTSCTGLTSVTIPESVTHIGIMAFQDCYFLNGKFVNNSTLSSQNNWGAKIYDEETDEGLLIKDHSIIRCRFWSTSVNIPSSITTINNNAFNGCIALTSVNIPNSVTYIGGGAFYGCNALTTVTIPESVTYIGEDAFDRSDNLDLSIILKTEEPINIKKRVFNEKTYIVGTLYVPSKSLSKYKNADVWNAFNFIKGGEPPTTLTSSNVNILTEQGERTLLAEEYDTTIYVKLSNIGKEIINSISYYVSHNGIDEEEQTYALPQPVSGANDSAESIELPISVPNTYNIGVHNIIYTISKVNDKDIHRRGYIKLCVFKPAEKHNIVIHETTSTSCGWSLRGNIGIKYLEEMYGDRIIHVATHIGDPMFADPIFYNIYTPGCEINCSGFLDPYYGNSISTPFGIKDDVEKFLNEPSPGSVRIIKAEWADPERTAINVDVESTFGYNDTELPFVLMFNVLEDKMKGNNDGWYQYNIYSGMEIDDPNLQPLTSLPLLIEDMEYNHVNVLDNDYPYFYEPGVSPYEIDTPQQVTFTIVLPDDNIIQNKDNLSLVVFLDDANYHNPDIGKIFDGDKSTISPYGGTSVTSAYQLPKSIDVYDIRGRKISSGKNSHENLPHGIYIIGGKKYIK